MHVVPPAGACIGLTREEFEAAVDHARDVISSDVLFPPTTRPTVLQMSVAVQDAFATLAIPDEGQPLSELVEFAREHVLSHPRGNLSPRFFGWVLSPPAHAGIVGELLAAAFNASCGGQGHAAILLESTVVRWLMELMEFPREGSHGILTSGGSAATLYALACARNRAAQSLGLDVRSLGLQGLGRRLVFYQSEATHVCVRRAVEVLGLGHNALRTIPVDARGELKVGLLRDAIRRDRDDGLLPSCVVATAGTVDTGAIDPLTAIAALCEAERLWLHIDGAYGAPAILDPRKRDRLCGMAMADSLSVDPHKWLYVPIECGCLLVRREEDLRDTFRVQSSYLNPSSDMPPAPMDYGVQFTRAFRALKLWMTLARAGRNGIARAIQKCNSLAADLAAKVADSGELELVAPTALSIVCFRYRGRGALADHALDAINESIVAELQREGIVFPTRTVVDAKVCIRAIILHYDTGSSDLDLLLERVVASGRRLAGALPAACATVEGHVGS